jgi:hypothetical protein
VAPLPTSPTATPYTPSSAPTPRATRFTPSDKAHLALLDFRDNIVLARTFVAGLSVETLQRF